MALGRLAAFEWRLLTAERTPWLLAAVFAGMAGYGAWNGAAWVRFQRETLARVAEEEQGRLARLADRARRIAAGDSAALRESPDPRNPIAVGFGSGARYATLPPGPLAPLAVGMSDLYPYYLRVTARSKETFVANDEIENPTNLLAGRLDLAFVIVFLYPLLLLALTYNVVSGEREAGTMGLLLSQPVPRERVLWTKLAVRAGVVTALAVLLTGLATLAAGVALDAPGAPGRLAWFVAIVVAYGLFWVAVAVAVNALGRGSAANALACLGAWLVVVVVVPALYAATVTTAVPSPSRVELTTRSREASDATAREAEALTAKFMTDHPELMPTGGAGPNIAWMRSVAVTEATEAAVQPVVDRFEAQRARQIALAERFRAVSPAIVAQGALIDLAGTGATRYRVFEEAVSRFHAEWRGFFFGRAARSQPVSAADWDRLPTFAFSDEPPGTIAARAGAALLWLLVPTAVIGLFGARRLARVPVAEP